MKTILVLAPHPELVEAIRAGLPPEHYRTLHRVSLEDAEPLLAHGMADVCVLDQDLNGVQGSWLVEKIRRKAPALPLLVVAGTRQPEWEEDACLKGVKCVLSKPLRPRLLEITLQQLLAVPSPLRSPAPPVFAPAPEPPRPSSVSGGGTAGQLQSLQVLRDFSAILSHSLEADALLRQFLQLIRELVGVNRASIFLRPSGAPFLGAEAKHDSQTLTSACGLGLSAAVLDVVKLSFTSGIGGHLQRTGRILRRHSPEAADVETQREFELLGAQVAIPILDREQVLGVALFDARVTGEPLVNAELELVFHLLEQVGLAVKNIRLHDQVAANHEMLADVMRELSSACIVVSRDLAVLHANRMARKYFGPTGGRAGELEFSDLPAALGSKVFQVLKTGSALAPFRHTPEGEPNTVYQVTVAPVHRAGSSVPTSVLLMVEDRTQAEMLHKLERESAAARHENELFLKMASKIVARIGNDILPVGVYAELMKDKWKDPEFRDKMEFSCKQSVARIQWVLEQLRLLSGQILGGGAGATGQSFSLAPMMDEALQAAQKHLPVALAEQSGKKVKYSNEFTKRPVFITGDREALKRAMTELLLNALHASPANAEIEVRDVPVDTEGTVCIEIKDNGLGFSQEAQAKAGTPFSAEDPPGVGCGLFLTRRILENNRGRLEIPHTGKPGLVRIHLPADKPAAK